MPPPPPHLHMESGDIWEVEAERLKGEVLCLAVKDGNSFTMQDQRCGFRNPIDSQFTHVNTLHELLLLEDAKVHIILGNPAQCGLDSTVTTIVDILQLKTYHMYCLLPTPLYPTYRTPHTLAHTLPPELVYPPRCSVRPFLRLPALHSHWLPSSGITTVLDLCR